MNDCLNGGINSNSNMLYADYLDYWINVSANIKNVIR